MKSSTTLTTISFTALLAGFAAIGCSGAEVEPTDQSQRAGLTQPEAEQAPARDGVKPEARGERHRGPRGERGFGPPSPEKFLERFDANKNGSLEASELPERMQERIADFDKSGDGIVTKDELDAQFKAKHADHAAKFVERAKARFEKQDANKDGMLDQTEVGSERWSKFSAADANGDQKLTQDELKAAFEAGKLKAPMKHGKHRGHPEHDGPAAPPAATPVPAL
jgi:EF hand